MDGLAGVKVSEAGVEGVDRNKFTTRSCEFAKTQKYGGPYAPNRQRPKSENFRTSNS